MLSCEGCRAGCHRKSTVCFDGPAREACAGTDSYGLSCSVGCVLGQGERGFAVAAAEVGVMVGGRLEANFLC